jgi:arginyl-tRNA--protein-N-Asp/Glu arginylyltransferase
MTAGSDRDAAASFQETFPCPYFGDGREATVEFIPLSRGNVRQYARLLAQGYRRFGGVFYRNVCTSCSACLPIRLQTAAFQPSRSQRRTTRMNRDLRMELASPAVVTEEKIELYAAYIHSKHRDAGDEESPEDSARTLSHVHYGYPFTLETVYYLGEQLVGVGILDEAEDALSSNYFYYDTSCLQRRLGVFSILREIDLARRMGKEYYYLGFYIRETAKMSYKGGFRPHQLLIGGHWKDASGPN